MVNSRAPRGTDTSVVRATTQYSFSINLLIMNDTLCSPAMCTMRITWEAVLKSVVARFALHDLKRFFEGDAVFALPQF